MTEIEKTSDLVVLAARVNRHHGRCLEAARTTVEAAVEAGRALIEAKSLLPHGHWLPWLEANCPDVGVRMAQKYARVARGVLEGKYEPSSHSTITAALVALTAPAHSESDRLEPLDRFQVGLKQGHKAVLEFEAKRLGLAHQHPAEPVYQTSESFLTSLPKYRAAWPALSVEETTDLLRDLYDGGSTCCRLTTPSRTRSRVQPCRNSRPRRVYGHRPGPNHRPTFWELTRWLKRILAVAAPSIQFALTVGRPPCTGTT